MKFTISQTQVRGPGQKVNNIKTDFKWIDQARFNLDMFKETANKQDEALTIKQSVASMYRQPKNASLSELQVIQQPYESISSNVQVQDSMDFSEQFQNQQSYTKLANKDFQSNLRKNHFNNLDDSDRKIIRFNDKSYLLAQYGKTYKDSQLQQQIIDSVNEQQQYQQSVIQQNQQHNSEVESIVPIQQQAQFNKSAVLHKLSDKIQQIDDLNFSEYDLAKSYLNYYTEDIKLEQTTYDDFNIQIYEILNIQQGPLSKVQTLDKLRAIIIQNEQLITENNKLKSKLIGINNDLGQFM
ncbi:hypothetical protein SS50377_23556 [Spironucleus salmonicida]|uniref:Uncharacterized protein n=1 Tax=Spironucleus salmonicida TaxID=348837 RepID=V6LWB3_9EUKA|nr:hypothetical protein SS50377_23556 [Spironucleus salmonicida]|eukprot:EST48538.1 Hypothetical protein SS50377_11149 [Spironucleus salmonicida]